MSEKIEPVAWMYLFPHDGETDHALALVPFLRRWIEVKGATETALYSAATVTALEARIAELEAKLNG